MTVFDIRKTFDDPNVTIIVGDLRKIEDCRNAVAGQDVVIHVASPHASVTNKDLLYGVNVDGTNNILNAAADAGVKRFVFTSSAR